LTIDGGVPSSRGADRKTSRGISARFCRPSPIYCALDLAELNYCAVRHAAPGRAVAQKCLAERGRA